MKYKYKLVKHQNDGGHLTDTNKWLELLDIEWQLDSWKVKKQYTILLFRKEVSNESNTE